MITPDTTKYWIKYRLYKSCRVGYRQSLHTTTKKKCQNEIGNLTSVSKNEGNFFRTVKNNLIYHWDIFFSCVVVMVVVLLPTFVIN